MKLSRFNLWVEDYPCAGQNLLFNTRTQALIRVDDELKKDLRKLSGLPHLAYSLKLKEKFKLLKENGIIVADEKEDADKLKDFFRQLKHDSHNLTFEATILTTYSCNFRCVYCFEEEVRENVFLEQTTSDLIVKWLINRAEKKGFKRISLVYYGGEPLLNVKPIYDISWQMKEWAENNGVGFEFAIITNGSLINPPLIDKLISVGLNYLRLTLDGYRDAHNKKRPFSGGKPSFDVIVNNIKEVIDKVNVGLAGNFDYENLESLPMLLDYLEEEGLLYKLKRVAFAPLAPRLGPRDNPGAIELSNCLSFFDKGGLFEEAINMKQELMRRGVKVKTGLAINACPLTMEDGGVTIDPKGLIYKCNSLLGYQEFFVGHVREEEFNHNYENFLNVDAWNKCAEDCPFVPVCQGGCRFYAYLENKNFSDLCCKREFFERTAPRIIKLDYENRLNQ